MIGLSNNIVKLNVDTMYANNKELGKILEDWRRWK
jgi:hypothetical protein